jgi:dephospho-CoA kinase
VLRIGLTGGIGAGKSEVARRLASYGAVVIDADAVAREVVAPGTAGLAEVASEFGPDVVRSDGSLDRARLGELVFADEALRRKLNAIVHPRVRERMAELERQAGDAPVIVPARIQLERLARERGMSREQAAARMHAQATREDRLAVADMVVDNSGSLAELDREVGDLWAELRKRALAARG